MVAGSWHLALYINSSRLKSNEKNGSPRTRARGMFYPVFFLICNCQNSYSGYLYHIPGLSRLIGLLSGDAAI